MMQVSYMFLKDLERKIQMSDLRVRQDRESPVDCRVMNIITSAKSFKNNARYLKNLAKSAAKYYFSR